MRRKHSEKTRIYQMKEDEEENERQIEDEKECSAV